MNYYDYSYGNSISVSSTAMEVWVIISIVVAVIGGIAIYFAFLRSKEDNYKGFISSLYNFFNFKKLTIEPLCKILYLVSSIALTLLSFCYIKDQFWLFLLLLTVGNISLRLAFEMVTMFISLFNNTNEINKKLKEKK